MLDADMADCSVVDNLLGTFKDQLLSAQKSLAITMYRINSPAVFETLGENVTIRILVDFES
jgi:hypothetical protein